MTWPCGFSWSRMEPFVQAHRDIGKELNADVALIYFSSQSPEFLRRPGENLTAILGHNQILLCLEYAIVSD
jgi:hypothetical protein